MSTDIRQRKPAPESQDNVPQEVPEPGMKTKEAPSIAARAKEEDNAGISLLDIARSIVFLLLVGSAVSYFVTRESFTFGIGRPKWTRWEVVRGWVNGPKTYTDADLRLYDGSNPDLSVPILLAINGTIYDVSNGRRHYGPGGTYHFFAGADASRAFVTSCFDTDITWDMRGVEEMYIPMDNEEVDRLYLSGELKVLRQRERRDAKKEVDKALKHWVNFFENSKKYHKVGYVKRDPAWEKKKPVPTLCKKAQEGRPKSRARPTGK